MLDNLTIVIITFNRYCFLKRLLSFYQSFETNVNILVLDSSSDEIKDEELIKQLNQKNIIWKKYDKKIFFATKISEGSTFINSKYAVLCADDDFLFPNSLKNAIQFLENNKSYSSCCGLQYKHHIIKFLKKNIPIFRKSALGGTSTDEENIFERLTKYLSGNSVYYPLYAVHRTLDFKKIWQDTATYANFWGLSEIFSCSLSLIFGKMKVLNIPYITRQKNNFNWLNKKILNKMYSLDKVEKAKKQLSKSITLLNKDSFEKNFILITKVFNLLIKKISNRVPNVEKVETFKFRLKTKIFKLPLIGPVVVKIYTKLISLIRLYLINRVYLFEHLDIKTKSSLKVALIDNECDELQIEKIRKNYASL